MNASCYSLEGCTTTPKGQQTYLQDETKEKLTRENVRLDLLERCDINQKVTYLMLGKGEGETLVT